MPDELMTLKQYRRVQDLAPAGADHAPSAQHHATIQLGYNHAIGGPTMEVRPAKARRAPKAQKVRESIVLRACLHYLTVLGIEAWRNNTGLAMLPGKGGKPQPVRFGKRGQADILGFFPAGHALAGRFLAIECKSSAGKLWPDQEAFLLRVRRAGGVAILARSLDELIAGLARAAAK